jgi:hypothetical protein
MSLTTIKTVSDLVEFNGGYLEDGKIVDLREAAPWVHGQAEADKLWTLSEDLIGERFPYVRNNGK